MRAAALLVLICAVATPVAAQTGVQPPAQLELTPAPALAQSEAFRADLVARRDAQRNATDDARIQQQHAERKAALQAAIADRVRAAPEAATIPEPATPSGD